MLGHDWEPAEGTCVDDEWVGHTDHRMWIMDVRPANGAPAFRTQVGHPGLGEDFKPPYIGHVCRMLVDVKKQKAKFDTSDPSLSWKAYRKMERQRVKDELNAPPGTAVPGAAGSYQVGSTSYQVVSGADAAPLLNAFFSGHTQEGLAALRALKQQAQQGGVPQMPTPAPAPFGADPQASTPAPFGADPQAPVPASFGSSFQSGPQQVTSEPAADLAARLNKLQVLHDQGLLSLSEFTAQRQRIIDSI